MNRQLDLQAVAERFVSTYDLSANDAAALGELLSTCTLRELVRGDVLFDEHARGDDMYLLLDGRVVASRKDARGQPLRVAALEAPSIAGHMSLIDGGPRTLTCTARRPTVVAVIDRKAFRALLDSVGPRGSVFRHLLLAAMSEQLASANDRVRTLIDPRTIGDIDDETTEHGIAQVAAALDGWPDEAGDD